MTASIPYTISVSVQTWQEEDADGTKWWFAQEVHLQHDGRAFPIGPVSKSRISRMRAESYVLAERAKELSEMT